MIGLPFHTISTLLQMRQSRVTHTVRYGITLVANLGSVFIACSGENKHMTLMTNFTRSPLMEPAMYRLFGVSATGAKAF
jgi:hypothetical protein